MIRIARMAHGFAIGVHLAGIALFAWMYSGTGNPAWIVYAGWSMFFGAYSTSWLRRSFKKPAIAA